MNSDLKNHPHANQRMVGMRPSPVVEFVNTRIGAHKRPMDLDAVILLADGSFLFCEFKHVRNMDVSMGEALTLQSLSQYMTDSGHRSYWVKAYHRIEAEEDYHLDDLRVDRYGIGNTVIGELNGSVSLREFRDKLNMRLKRKVPDYERYKPVKCDFIFQMSDGGMVMGLVSDTGADIDRDTVLIFRKIADRINSLGRRSCLLLCQWKELTEKGSTMLENCITRHMYDGEWTRPDLTPMEIFTEWNRNAAGKNKGYYFDVSILN